MNKIVSLPVTVRISASKVDQLDALAGATDRTRAWHVEQAVDAYLEVQHWQVQHITEGLAEVQTDAGVPQEEIEDYLDSWGQDDAADRRE